MSPRVAFVFPGQGEKRVDVALRAALRTELGRELCEMASEASGAPLRLLETRPDLLDRQMVYQAMMTALSLSAAEALSRAGVRPSVVMGHSLGELAAWAAGGAFSPRKAIRLAALRGRLMGREAGSNPGGMVALSTGDGAAIKAALAEGGSRGRLCVAAYNAPDEVVLSGDEPAIRGGAVVCAGDRDARPDAGPVAQPGHEAHRLRDGVPFSPGGPGAAPVRLRAEPHRRAVPRRPAGRVARALQLARSPDSSFAGPAALTGVAGSPVPGLVDAAGTSICRRSSRSSSCDRCRGAKCVRSLLGLADIVVMMGPTAVLRSLWHRNVRAEVASGARSSGDLPVLYSTG
ncbi:MAG: acyltransferase domain-containing protein [Polyangiaceae bacterium]